MSLKNKIMVARVLPKAATKYIRIGVVSLLLLAIAEPTYRIVNNSSVTFKHADVESGVFCNIEYGGVLESFDCYKNDSIGLELSELDLLPKIWEYEIDGKIDALSVERKGYSEGLEFTVRGSLLRGEKTVKIPYPKQ